MSLEQSRATRIDVIDGLRGIAILGVIYTHVTVQKLTPPGWHGIDIGGFLLSPFTMFSNGGHGVPLFFLLSGFVLYLPYALGLRTMVQWKDVIAFYHRRARRLLPLYYIHIFFLATFIRVAAYPRETLKTLFLMSSFLFPFSYAWLEVCKKFNLGLWSLGVELWFCVLMPFIVWGAKKIGFRPVLLAFILLALGARFTYGMVFPSKVFWWSMNSIGGCLVDFVLGMTIAHEYATATIRTERNRWLVLGAVIILFGFLCSDLMLIRQAPVSLMEINELLVVIGFALFLYGLLFTRIKIVRFLFANWPLQLIGMMCYSLYIWHNNAITSLQPFQSPIRFLRYAFLLGTLSFLSYRYIEFGFVRDIRLLLPPWHGKPKADDQLAIVSQ